MADAISIAEFKKRNEEFNQQLHALENQLASIHAEVQRQKDTALDTQKIRAALERELSFEDGFNSELVSTILEKAVVKKESTKEELHLDIYLKFGTKFEAIFTPASFSRAKNTTLPTQIRRT